MPIWILIHKYLKIQTYDFIDLFNLNNFSAFWIGTEPNDEIFFRFKRVHDPNPGISINIQRNQSTIVCLVNDFFGNFCQFFILTKPRLYSNPKSTKSL